MRGYLRATTSVVWLYLIAAADWTEMRALKSDPMQMNYM
jgi:hypothetical protein